VRRSSRQKHLHGRLPTGNIVQAVMETLNSQEVVGSLKPGGVVIGVPEEQKRGFAASNRTAGNLIHRRNGLRALIPMIGLKSQSRRRPPR
jgi:hypothetical protein